MLTEYTTSQLETSKAYFLVYDDGKGNGFWFPCDKDGNLLSDISDEARENQIFCLHHPEQFTRWNKVVEEEREYYTDPIGVCECGTKFALRDTYCGSCECPSCGKWYNLFGQELLPPEDWSQEDLYDVDHCKYYGEGGLY